MQAQREYHPTQSHPGTLNLVIAARKGSEAAMRFLITSNRDIVLRKARKYYLRGGDTDDTIQEGLIGLFKAIRDFRVDSPVSFRSFATVCVERQLVTAVRMASRNKHSPLNASVSMSAPSGDSGAKAAIDNLLAGGCCGDPADYVCSLEGCCAIHSTLDSDLSDLEREVVLMSAGGRRYDDISRALGCGAKSVDNALQRARRKIARTMVLH